MQSARSSSLKPTLFLIWVSVESLCAQEAGQTAPRRSNPDVEAIISGYRANRSRIPFGRVKIVKTEGFALSVDDALARQWLDDALARHQRPEWPPTRTERLWIFDGETSRFEDTEVAEQPLYGSSIVVRNKHFEIRRSPKMEYTRVEPVEKRFFQEPWSPFLNGNGMCASAENEDVEFDGECELNGRLALVFATSHRLTGQQLNRYWVDPAGGFLPVRIEEPGPGNRIYVFEEFMQNSGGGWMPRRWVEIYPTHNAELPRRVAECEVTEWNFEDPPGADFFLVSVEAGESFSYRSGEQARSPATFRVLGTEIDLRWFKEDSSIDAPEGAIEIVRPEVPRVMDIQDYIQTRYPPDLWQLAAVLAVSIAAGFGCLFLLDWIRRRRRARANSNQSSGTGTRQRSG